MKKKLLGFIFAMCLIIPCAVMLTACGNKNNENVVGENATPTPTPPINYEVTINGLVYDRDTTTNSYYVKSCVPEIINNTVTITVEDEIEDLPVTKINKKVFYDSDTSYYSGNKIKLHNIVIPNTVKYIDEAFCGCVELESITFESGSQIETIDYGTFDGCMKLKAIEFPASIITIENFNFDACYELKHIMFEEGSKIKNLSISASLNYQLYNLESVELPEGLEYLVIDVQNSIKINSLPNSLKYISMVVDEDLYTSENGMYYLPNSGANGVEVNSHFALMGVESIYLDSYTINETTRLINGRSIYKLTNLTEIIIPDSVISISFDAFIWCDKLETIIVYKNAVNSFDLRQILQNCDNFINLYIESDAIIPEEVTENFTLSPNSDKDGFYLYIRNTESK